VSAHSFFSPAKINLFLAITGRRADGFHELVSVVAPVEFGDTLRVQETGDGGQETGEQFTLECDNPAVPVDGTNLVLRAVSAFAEETGWRGGAKFFLEKRIPVGAGLGGGSSNAVAALRALNQLAGGPLDAARQAEIAAGLGSDCPLFLHDGPVVMRGRGERVEALPADAMARLRGRRVLIFKPGFGISTAWAYARMAVDAPRHYLPAAEVEARLAAWITGEASAEELLCNGMEGVAFEKFLALPVLLEALREEFGLVARMSGSGSACLALLGPAAPVAAITARIREFWGEAVFVTETKIL
jgi:4-diphosphocytidyl-2-C-methyl-D-erythritol kinase